MRECLFEAEGAQIEAFDQIAPADMWRRKSVKSFKAGKVADLEWGPLLEQCFLVIHGKTEEDRTLALARVEELTGYIVKLVHSKIKGGK